MEAERKRLGLEGVLFRYYSCSGCGLNHIFVDIHPLEDESEEALLKRKNELESTLQQLHGEKVKVVLIERNRP
jgi:hypothetical protein